MGPLLLKKDAKAAAPGLSVQQVVLAVYAAQQQTPVVLVGAAQGGAGTEELQLPSGSEPRKSGSSVVHALLGRVLRRPPAATQLIDLGVKDGTCGFAVVWDDAGQPMPNWW